MPFPTPMSPAWRLVAVDRVALMLAGRLLANELPPEDAAAWTRIVCEMARAAGLRKKTT